MKKNILYIMIFMQLLFCSCNKWLDITPQTEIPTKDMFQKEQGYEDAIIGCYIKMADNSLYGLTLSIREIESMAQMWGNLDEANQKDLISLKNFDFEAASAQSKFRAVYQNLYNIISQANIILENIEESGNVIKSKTKRDIIKGEALAIRAFCHFDLLRIFGQVPMGASVNVSLPYSEKTGIEGAEHFTFAAYSEKVKKDINDAVTLMASDPVKTYGVAKLNSFSATTDYDLDEFLTFRRFRLNYFAAKALQARICLYLGDNATANQAALEVINAKDKDSKEAISLSTDADFVAFNNALPTETIFGLSKSALENMQTEIRLLKLGKNQKKELFTGRNTASNNRFNLVWGKGVENVGSEYDILNKYVQNKDQSENKSESFKIQNRWFIPILRLSEMYLIAMESSTNLAQINELYKTYMLARNEQVDGFEGIESAKEEILNEYRREFFAEGQMFFTYKRLNSSKMLWSNAKILEVNYIMPVPKSEIKK